MKQAYIEKRFSPAIAALLAQANLIVEEYVEQGYRLTVRQLYYQLVARGFIENNMASYTRVCTTLNDGRMAGHVDWDAIEDRTRELVTPARWESAGSMLEACAEQFHVDMWEGQAVRPFVVVEKEALAGVMARVCDKWDLPLLAARGYPSISVLREFAVGPISKAIMAEQKVLLLHFGDHDPSGIDMTRDLTERLQLFTIHDVVRKARRHRRDLNDADKATEWFLSKFELQRVALNMDQVEEYNPPPNPAKATDSRFADYQAKHGDESWELDALEPALLNRLVEDIVEPLVDQDAWDERLAAKEEGKDYIAKAAEEAP
jgi:hypothetical protein